MIEDEKSANGYSYLINAMLRWYRSLPKYTKQMKKVYCGSADGSEKKSVLVQKEYSEFLNILKQGGFGANEILFEKIPCAFKKEKLEQTDFALAENIKNAKNFFDSALEGFTEKIIEDTKNSFDKNAGEKSLKNVVAEFCTKLDSETENHVFENGAHSLLKIYKSAGNDEKQIAGEMAKVLTGLSIDDWNDETVGVFFERLDELNKTLMEFRNPLGIRQAQCPPDSSEKSASSKVETSDDAANNYEIRFAHSGTENAKSKSFKKVECSVRAKSLEEEIWRTIEEMGQSVTDAEKRQVLVSLLEKLC